MKVVCCEYCKIFLGSENFTVCNILRYWLFTECRAQLPSGQYYQIWSSNNVKFIDTLRPYTWIRLNYDHKKHSSYSVPRALLLHTDSTEYSRFVWRRRRWCKNHREFNCAGVTELGKKRDTTVSVIQRDWLNINVGQDLPLQASKVIWLNWITILYKWQVAVLSHIRRLFLFKTIF
jgi:hypothetical protein